MTAALNGVAERPLTTRGRRSGATSGGLVLSPRDARRLAAELTRLATEIEDGHRAQSGHDGEHRAAPLDPTTADRVEFLRDVAGLAQELSTGGEAQSS